VGRDVATQALLATHEWPEGGDVLERRAAAGLPEGAAWEGSWEGAIHMNEITEIT
jgi:hypothetical protein